MDGVAFEDCPVVRAGEATINDWRCLLAEPIVSFLGAGDCAPFLEGCPLFLVVVIDL